MLEMYFYGVHARTSILRPTLSDLGEEWSLACIQNDAQNDAATIAASISGEGTSGSWIGYYDMAEARGATNDGVRQFACGSSRYPDPMAYSKLGDVDAANTCLTRPDWCVSLIVSDDNANDDGTWDDIRCTVKRAPLCSRTDGKNHIY